MVYALGKVADGVVGGRGSGEAWLRGLEGEFKRAYGGEKRA